MEWWSIILALVAVLVALSFSSIRNMKRFKDHGIPFQWTIPHIGSMWSLILRRISISDMALKLYNTNREAKYIGMFDRNSPVIMLRDPELMKTVLVKNFDHFPHHASFVVDDLDTLFSKNLFGLKGDRWREVRSMLSPVFTTSKMRGMYKLMYKCAIEFTDFLAQLPVEEKTMDVKDAFTRYTNDVIGTCAFGLEVNSMKDRNNQFYVYGRQATDFSGISGIKFFLIRSAPLLARIFGLRLIRLEIAKFFTDLIADTIKTRDERGIVRPDVIQQLMEHRDKLTIEDMTAQAFVFFFGGFESTASIMCFAAHELAVNPEVQKRLQEEIDNVLDDNDGEVSYEALNEMKFMDAVIQETLRLYPIVVITDRECVKPYELPPALPGGKPYTIQPGSYVWFSMYGMHRDPQYFKEPTKFDPDRFLDGEERNHLNSGVFIPFGVGPRMCIGNRFAMLEAKVLLLHLLARSDLKPCDKTLNPMRMSKKAINMVPETGFFMTIEPRSQPHPSVVKRVANGGN